MSRFRNAVLSEPLTGSGVRLATVYSPALRRRGDLSLYLPVVRPGQRLPLLILLHGVHGSHWNWWVLGDVHKTAQEMIASGEIRPFAIAMPSDGLWGEGSAYVPHPEFDAEAWIVEDVPGFLGETQLPIETDRFYLAGQSMGGFGALRLGMKYAERVKGISAHSAVTRISDLEPYVQTPVRDYLHSGQENTSITEWARANRPFLPPIRFDCGRDDSLFEANRQLHIALLQHGILHTYEEHAGGHTWEYWQCHVRSTLKFFSDIEQCADSISSRA